MITGSPVITEDTQSRISGSSAGWMPCGLDAELNGNHGVIRTVRDVGGHSGLRLGSHLPAADLGVEAAHHQQPRSAGAVLSDRHPAGHYRSLAEPPDHGLLPLDAPLGQLAVQEAAERPDGLQKGSFVGMPDLPDHVPVPTARRDVRERRPRRHPEQLSLRIELIEQGVEVALVDATAVQENQRAPRVARRLAIEVDQLGSLVRLIGTFRL